MIFPGFDDILLKVVGHWPSCMVTPFMTQLNAFMSFWTPTPRDMRPLNRLGGKLWKPLFSLIWNCFQKGGRMSFNLRPPAPPPPTWHVPDGSWIDPASTKQMTKTGSTNYPESFKKLLFVDPKASPSRPGTFYRSPVNVNEQKCSWILNKLVFGPHLPIEISKALRVVFHGCLQKVCVSFEWKESSRS